MVAGCRITIGLVRAQFGDGAKGVGLIRQGIAHFDQIGQGSAAAPRLGTLAQAQCQAGSLSDALETIQGALKASPDLPIYRAEIRRISGELLAKSGRTEAAEGYLREAIALAQRMDAKSLELRAAVGLTRLLRDTGRAAEARAMLAQIYHWFTEGFDTADLIDARALLAELVA